MLKRKIYDKLLDWKYKRKTEGIKKCLLVKGARKVGKFFIIKEFGKQEYKSSLNDFINDFSPSIAYKLIGGRNGKVGVKETLPYYFVLLL